MLLWDNKFDATNIPLSPFSSVIIYTVETNNNVVICLNVAGIKKLTSYFKQLTKDEMEVEDSLATHQLSKTASIESGLHAEQHHC